MLWDCISLIDRAAIRVVEAQGGLGAIAISHPHYYASMVEWSRAFDGAPIYLHADDRRWVMRPDPAIVFWEGDALEIGDGLTLLRLGGHFAGAQVLHWSGGAAGRGVLLAGDILQVVQDRRFVSFMYSYPNYIPLPAATVRRMVRMLEPYPFERVYGAWFGAVVRADAKRAVQRSAERYVQALETDRAGGLPEARSGAVEKAASRPRGTGQRAGSPSRAPAPAGRRTSVACATRMRAGDRPAQ